MSQLPIPDGLVARPSATPGEGFPFDIMVAPEAAAPGFLFGGPTSGTIAFVLDADGLPLGMAAQVGAGPDASPLPDRFAARLRGPVPQAVQVAVRDGAATMQETEIIGVPVRAYTAPIGGDQAAVVQVVSDRTTELRTLQVTLLVLLVGGVAATLAAAAFGWVYAGRALVPMPQIGSAASVSSPPTPATSSGRP